ncbi:hypothetical protein DB347_22470 [Opitutaceae bacterium EW11]|nr:hypothetical protein DB347_22470 [Opitutaceae bacterium EW11]
MSSSWPLSTWLLLGQAAAMLAVAAWAWRQRATPGALAFTGLLVSVAVYVGLFAMELPATDVATLQWVGAIEYVGIAFIPPFVLFTYSAVAGMTGWLTRWTRWSLLAFSAVCAALKLFDPWLGTIYRTLAIDRQYGFTIATFDVGPLYYVVVAYLEGSFLTGFLMAYRAWRKSSGLRQRQLTSMMLGAAFPWAAHIVYISGLSPWGRFDFVPFAIFGTTVAVAWAVFREQLIAVTPIARDFVVDHLQDSVVVLDAHGIIVDFNPAARRTLGIADSDWGRFGADALNSWPDLKALCAADEERRCEFNPEVDGDICWEAGWHPLSDPQGRPRGYVLTIHDVSERKRNEGKLEQLVSARTAAWREASETALRVIETEQVRVSRTLHDTVCQDLIAVARKIDECAAQMREHRLESVAARLTELSATITSSSKKAHDISHLFGDPDFEDPSAGLKPTLQHIQESTGMACAIHQEGEFPALDPDRARHLYRIVREAAMNAVRHGHARQFWIDCVSARGVSTISICNDGTSIVPEGRRQEGLGLRLMRMRADLIGASFAVRPRTPFGTVVELTLPAGPR